MTVNWFMPPSINVKNKLRISLIERRQALSPDEVIDCSKKVNEFCFNYLELNHHKNILTYLQINNEINTEKLIVSMLKKGLNIFLAKQEVGNVNQVFIKKVKKDNSGLKSFVVENTHYVMSLNYFDLIILPLVGVDSKGYRLGLVMATSINSFVILKIIIQKNYNRVRLCFSINFRKLCRKS